MLVHRRRYIRAVKVEIHSANEISHRNDRVTRYEEVYDFFAELLDHRHVQATARRIDVTRRRVVGSSPGRLKSLLKDQPVPGEKENAVRFLLLRQVADKTRHTKDGRQHDQMRDRKPIVRIRIGLMTRQTFLQEGNAGVVEPVTFCRITSPGNMTWRLCQQE